MCVCVFEFLGRKKRKGKTERERESEQACVQASFVARRAGEVKVKVIISRWLLCDARR